LFLLDSSEIKWKTNVFSCIVSGLIISPDLKDYSHKEYQICQEVSDSKVNSRISHQNHKRPNDLSCYTNEYSIFIYIICLTTGDLFLS